MNTTHEVRGPMAIGCDHAAYELKEKIKNHLADKGFQVEDMGTHGPESVDYPDFAAKVASAVSDGRIKRGILICGTGLGMSMAANRYPGVRAALCSESFSARMSREHNDSNILVLGARVTGENLAYDIVDTWLNTPFGGDRHQRRIDLIDDMLEK